MSRVVGNRGSVVTTGEGLVVFVGSGAGNSRASVGGIVRGTNVVSKRRSGEATSASSSNLRVAETRVLVLATSEEATTATTASVVVGRTGAEALLLLVVARKEHLD